MCSQIGNPRSHSFTRKSWDLNSEYRCPDGNQHEKKSFEIRIMARAGSLHPSSFCITTPFSLGRSRLYQHAWHMYMHKVCLTPRGHETQPTSNPPDRCYMYGLCDMFQNTRYIKDERVWSHLHSVSNAKHYITLRPNAHFQNSRIPFSFAFRGVIRIPKQNDWGPCDNFGMTLIRQADIWRSVPQKFGMEGAKRLFRERLFGVCRTWSSERSAHNFIRPLMRLSCSTRGFNPIGRHRVSRSMEGSRNFSANSASSKCMVIGAPLKDIWSGPCTFGNLQRLCISQLCDTLHKPTAELGDGWDC